MEEIVKYENTINPEDIILDEDFEMSVNSKYLGLKIRLRLSDDLDAAYEELTDDYRKKIADFVNELPQWYDKACDAVIEWGKKLYNTDAQEKDIRLMNICVLFEKNEEELFGLEFRPEFEAEHGCGVVIRGKKYDYKIKNIDTADCAFYIPNKDYYKEA